MTQQTQLALFDELPTIETLLTKREDQWFDRKSFRIEAVRLADGMIGFANADGGRIAIGIHNDEIEGIDANIDHVNALQQASRDFCEPPVRHAVLFVACVNRHGQPDRVLVLDIEASEQVHRNRKGECFLRVGDENRRLGSTEERELTFDKGETVYDKTIVEDLAWEDLDHEAIEAYATKIGASDRAALLRSRGLYLDGPYR